MDGFPISEHDAQRIVELPHQVRIREGYLDWARYPAGYNHREAFENYERDPDAYFRNWLMPRGQYDDDLLIEFANLCRGDDASIADFAKRRGVLYARPPAESWTPDAVRWSGCGRVARGVVLLVESDPRDLRKTTDAGQVYYSYRDDFAARERVPADRSRRARFNAALRQERVAAPTIWTCEPLSVWRNASATIDLLWRFTIALRRADGAIHPLRLAEEWGYWLPADNARDWNEWLKWPLGIVAALMWENAGAGDYSKRVDLPGQRQELNRWLDALCHRQLARLSIGVQWGDTATPRIVARLPLDQSADIEPFHVFPAVVLRLIVEAAGGKRAICADCNQFFTPSGRKRCCEDCRASAGKARRRRWRSANKDAVNAQRRAKYATAKRPDPTTAL